MIDRVAEPAEPLEAPVSTDAPTGSGDTAAAFQLRGNPPRVMRLSRKTLAVIGVAASLSIGGSLIYALHPPLHQAGENLYDTDGRNKADVVTSAPADYAKVPKLGQALPGDLGRPILSAQRDRESVPVPPMGSPGSSSPDPKAAAAEQARQRVGQERDAARTSRLFLGGINLATAGAPSIVSATTNPSPSAASTDVPAAPPTPGSSSPQAGNRTFLRDAGNRTVTSSERVSDPASPSTLQAGSIIPAALITGIRSDLPGQITAQVTQNVYDSPTGRVLLIPQGARLIGEYSSEIAAGQNRVLLAWDRVILPDGRSILLDRQPGADSAGMAGLQDRTDYHWGAMLKAALISTLLGVGTEFATNNDDQLVQALRYGTQDTVNQTGRQLVQRQVNVPPTLTIRPGFPLRVIVTRDLIIEPAEGGR